MTMFNLFRRKKRVNIETDFGKYPDDTRQFVGEWIATYDDRIIAHSKDLHELMKELDAKYPEIAEDIAYDHVREEGIWIVCSSLS
jgi:hypothetical protein